ncbi:MULTISPECIES: diaminopimelate decarboxylase [Anaerolinea]|uniref:diaminopimelate decarboxylase n=1 Tax=Anaerolinea TaxID=233189 RepID=UPI002613F754|nr:diaminopimelate decarboxylase [Anaerolinea thermophila]
MKNIYSLLPDSASVSENGDFIISRFTIKELAEKYGTPLYIYDAVTVQRNIQILRNCLSRYYPGDSTITYAAKAYFSYPFAQHIAKMGIGVDIVSENELLFALKAGISPHKIHLHGNNKTDSELDGAIQSNIHAIVLDNFDDLNRLTHLSTRNYSVPVWIRINPEIDVNTHPYRQTGHALSKFGFTISDGQAENAIRELLSNPKFQLRGIHTHIGSQIFDPHTYSEAIHKMLAVAKKSQWLPVEVCPGGGWGVPYHLEEIDLDTGIEHWIKEISKTIQEEYQDTSFIPHLFLEPGRWIVARAGIAVYRVGGIKSLPNGEKLLAIDGGMGDNIRPSLYQAKYEALLAENPLGKPVTRYKVVGRYCESGDTLLEEIDLPEVQAGNHLIIPVAGAYHLSMASNYNLVPRPAVLWIENGEVTVLQKRENLWDSWWC